MKYQQALLDTTGGLFSVSVGGDVELDNRGHIVNARAVFDDGSIIVAVQQGVPPVGDFKEHPNPLETAEIEARSPENGGGRLGPRKFHSSGPLYGAFIVQIDSSNQVTLRKIPELGQFT